MSQQFNFENDVLRMLEEYGGAFELPELESAAGWQSEINRKSGNYVRWIQISLNRIIAAQLVVDGIQGTKTTAAVKNFQKQAGLVVDGIVGPKTEAALLAAGAEPPPGSATPAKPSAPRPLGPNELLQVIKPRAASKSAANLPIHLNLALPSSAVPQIALPKVEASGSSVGQLALKQIKLVLQGAAGQVALPPSIPITSLTQQTSAVSNAAQAGFLPAHLSLRPLPQAMPYHLIAKPNASVFAETGAELYRPTTVFKPEDRRVFQDTSYPWCTTGRVDTPGNFCSGVMIGPRHMLTCSHGIKWNSDGSAGSVKFTPAYFDGGVGPFGDAMGIRIYNMKKVDGSDLIDRDEARSDYVVVVLNSRLGDVTGWMGSRTYSDSWDGDALWNHVGYPFDLNSGQRPTFQPSISLDGAFFDSDSRKRIFHKGDVFGGQSGGPFFAWWKGETYPSVVAVQSSEKSSENLASGGSDLVTLIAKARTDFP
jgi:peptidoglycan hydrolase-like protein with peptidoglycan-binding domain/V8-like Glu-specific endopeptidase